MQQNLKNHILKLYSEGTSSVKISQLLKISKPKVLSILHSEGVVRKRDRCNTLNFIIKNNYYIVSRQCPKCKKEIQTKSKTKIIACRNHFTKVNKNSLCKPCSLKLQVGKGNPFYGKKHKMSSKIKISKGKIGKNVGEKNAMSKAENRKKVSENLKKSWGSGKLESTRKKMSEQMKKTIREGKIKSVITSKKEKEIFRFLKSKGYQVQRFYRIDTKICDLFLPSLNLIIEYFGDYWHCNPTKYSSDYFNQKKSMTAQQIWDYDNSKVDLIKSYGYNLEVIWESEIKTDTNKILTIINKYDKSKNATPERSSKDSTISSPI